MAKFKIGDRVKINDKDGANDAVGKLATIIDVNDSRAKYKYQLHIDGDEPDGYPAYCDKELDLIKETTAMTTKYYRVIKDHPLFETGAIISNEDSDGNYSAINSVFVKQFEGTDNDNWVEGRKLVENQPEWFEQVYPLGNLKKAVFGTRKQAQAAAAALYEGDNDK